MTKPTARVGRVGKKKKRSSRKRTLKLLEYAANAKLRVKHWPRYESAFPALSVNLAHAVASAVMDNTWDSSGVENWDWNGYAEHFTFDVVSMFRVGEKGSNRSVRMSSTFHLDPRKDLLAELDRISGEVKTYSNDFLHMHRAYHAIKGTTA